MTVPRLFDTARAARLGALWSLLAGLVGGCAESDDDCAEAGAQCPCDGGSGRLVCGDGGLACECSPLGQRPELRPDAMCVAASSEVCNGRDDDCDGRIDEQDGVCQQAGTCFAGHRACGLTPEGPGLVCRDGTGADRPPSGAERCSGLDDDCDGRVDEGFDPMSDPENCGGCGLRCAAPLGLPLDGATFGCVDGQCVVEACGPGLEDRDEAPENGCECAPAELDRPDVRFVDRDCDGLLDEDVDADGAVFVHPEGRPGGDGSPGDPVDGLDGAVALAEASGRREVIMAAGTFDPFAGLPGDDPQRSMGWPMPDGLWLRGGFVVEGERWHRPPRGDSRTVLTGGSPVVRIARSTRTTVLDAVDVVAAPGVDGRAGDDGGVAGSGSVALFAEDVGEHLLIANSALESDDGGRGHRGPPGGDGRLGGDGGRPGTLAAVAECPHPERPAACGGLRGITRACAVPVTVPVGGNGGHSDGFGLPGAAWAGTDRAAGGAAGRTGEVGAMGAVGGSGVPGTASGRVTADGRWVPGAGTEGAAGRPGNGGGGGGGSADLGGGGGGGGGCPGLPGHGAEGGHGSFALVVRGGRVNLLDVPFGGRPGRLELIAARGGPGGPGGRGGSGGSGGRGGEGSPEDGVCPGCSAGAVGGLGGRGGCGGHGGPGAGGPSFAVLRVPPAGGSINDSRVVFLEAVADPLDTEQRRPVADTAAAVAAYLRTGGGGAGGAAAESPQCPQTTEAGPRGASGSVGCCVADEQGRCAPLAPCTP